MTSSERDLLYKDLCGRIPYGVVLEHTGPEGFVGSLKLEYVDEYYEVSLEDHSTDLYPIEHFKPYLRELHDVTEDELCDFAHKIYDDIIEVGHTGKGFINVKLSSNPFWCQINSHTLLESWKGIDFLNSIHVDYRGLIDKNLAFVVTKHPDWYPMHTDYEHIYGNPDVERVKLPIKTMTLEEAKKIRSENGLGYSTTDFIKALQVIEERIEKGKNDT